MCYPKVEDTKIILKKKVLKDVKKRKRMSSEESLLGNTGYYAALDQGIEIRNPRKKKGENYGEKRPVGRPSQGSHFQHLFLSEPKFFKKM